MQFRKRGGGAQPPPFASLPKMTLFSSLLPPKANSPGFSILCAGEDAFAHLFVLQRRLSFTVLCFLLFTPQRIRLAFAFLSVGEDASFMIISFFFAFDPLKRFSCGFLLLVCWRRRVYSFLHGLRERGGWGGRSPPPAHLQRGGPFEEGCEGDFAKGFPFGEDTFILLIIVIVIVIVIAIVIVRNQSVKAEQRGSREAQKLKSKRKAQEEESNQQEKQQAIKAGKSRKRKLKEKKRSRKSEKQKSKTSGKAEKQKSIEAEKRREAKKILKQGRAASKNLKKRTAKQTIREAEKQRSKRSKRSGKT